MLIIIISVFIWYLNRIWFLKSMFKPRLCTESVLVIYDYFVLIFRGVDPSITHMWWRKEGQQKVWNVHKLQVVTCKSDRWKWQVTVKGDIDRWHWRLTLIGDIDRWHWQATGDSNRWQVKLTVESYTWQWHVIATGDSERNWWWWKVSMKGNSERWVYCKVLNV